MNATKSSGIEFLTRVGDRHETLGVHPVPLREMVLVHPPMPNTTEDQVSDVK